MRKLYSISLSVALLSLSLAAPSQALVKMGAPEKTEIKGIALSSTAQVDEQSPALKRVTQGLRQKKVVMAWFSVYVAQFFSNSAVDVKSVSSLKESLLKGLPVIVTMTFARDVDNEKIVDGFKEVFQENGTDIESAPFKDYIEAVQKSGDVKDRQVYTFVFSQDKGKESFRFQTNGKEFYAIQGQAPGTLSKFMNMWLGKPVDSGLEQLQEQVLKP